MEETIEEKFQQWLRLTFPTYVFQDDQTKWLRVAYFAGFEGMFCHQCPRKHAHRIQDEIDAFNSKTRGDTSAKGVG